jgi:hypothetical protein
MTQKSGGRRSSATLARTRSRSERGSKTGLVWALRIRAGNREWLAEARRYNYLLSRTVPLAVHLWHEPCVALRDGDEVLCICGRCSALGYGDATEGVVGGALFEDECPNEGLPAITALTVTHVARSRWPSER